MFKILNGNSLEVLKTLEAESIDCVVTSPPYWSLRDYGGPEQIWDGDANCGHVWGTKYETKQSGGGWAKPGYDKCSQKKDWALGKVSQGFSCDKCSAWRGHLGLEPHFNLYISHLIQIFDEVKRVLKKTGTCFVNLGDTYSGGKGSSSGYYVEERDKKRQTLQKEQHYLGGRGIIRPADGNIGIPAKSLCNIPSRFAIAMTDRGWILRNEIIWEKPNCMPESCNDRFTRNFEKIFFFTKSRKYYFKQQFEPVKQCSIDRLQRAVSNKHKHVQGAPGQSTQGIFKPRHYKGGGTKGRDNNCAISSHLFNGGDYLVASFNPEKGRNMRCVWAIPIQSYSGDHFAVYPEALCERPIKAGCPSGGIVLDPFCGHGTTGRVAVRLGRKFIGIDIVPENCEASKKRIVLPLFSQESALSGGLVEHKALELLNLVKNKEAEVAK